jgi:hypothetical protein
MQWNYGLPNRIGVHKFCHSRIGPISLMKIKFCSLGIISNILSFVVQTKSFLSISYPRTTDLYKHSIRVLLFSLRGLEKQFLILFILKFMFSSNIRGAIFHYCSFCSESLSSGWLQISQIGHWIRPVGSLISLRKWTFKQWIRNRSCGKHQNKRSHLGAAKAFAAVPQGVENSEPITFLGRREKFETMSKGIVLLLEVIDAVYSFSDHYWDHWTAESHITRRAFTGRSIGLTNCPRPPLHNSILVHCEAVSMSPRGRIRTNITLSQTDIPVRSSLMPCPWASTKADGNQRPLLWHLTIESFTERKTIVGLHWK